MIANILLFFIDYNLDIPGNLTYFIENMPSKLTYSCSIIVIEL